MWLEITWYAGVAFGIMGLLKRSQNKTETMFHCVQLMELVKTVLQKRINMHEKLTLSDHHIKCVHIMCMMKLGATESGAGIESGGGGKMQSPRVRDQ